MRWNILFIFLSHFQNPFHVPLPFGWSWEKGEGKGREDEERAREREREEEEEEEEKKKKEVWGFKIKCEWSKIKTASYL